MYLIALLLSTVVATAENLSMFGFRSGIFYNRYIVCSHVGENYACSEWGMLKDAMEVYSQLSSTGAIVFVYDQRYNQIQEAAGVRSVQSGMYFSLVQYYDYEAKAFQSKVIYEADNRSDDDEHLSMLLPHRYGRFVVCAHKDGDYNCNGFKQLPIVNTVFNKLFTNAEVDGAFIYDHEARTIILSETVQKKPEVKTSVAKDEKK